ncbi:MAG: ABC transporter ATP-binding protein [Candidatus Kerfeldbacteria bacterium]|nr:ABC transporter ATP-binding protein [Candidatus Kerfeldbacteria bacterium]
MLQLQGINKVYFRGSERLEVLKNISFSVERGEFVAIMGPSGSGKSTLMNIIGCLDVPTSGSYILDGNDISSLKPRQLARIRLTSIGFIFQNFNLLPRLSALGNVLVPLVYSGATDRDRKAQRMLERVGLGGRVMHRPRQLSGGEMQRVAIARALMNNPKVVLADEPTGNLDSRSGVEIMKLFHELHGQGRTIMMVTHDHDLARNADRVITLYDGTLQSDAPTPR